MLKRNSTHISRAPSWCGRGGVLGAVLLLICGVTWPRLGAAQLDICECKDSPESLGAFNSRDPATYPPGTTSRNIFPGPFTILDELTIPLPADGALIFDSFDVRLGQTGRFAIVLFKRNAANTPVTIRVAGDVTIAAGASVRVNGEPGTVGSSIAAGDGGLGGPGGFRGGDGAYQLVNLASGGGAGFGPRGGAAGTASPLASGGNGTFLGGRELLPLVGGSGGGGGASNSNAASCAGGGGGGGGGAILIAANGTITVNGNILADGGCGQAPGASSCASSGGAGSGGAIRLAASTIAGSGGSSALAARGCDATGNPGAIRLEAFTNTLAPSVMDPPATRFPAPGPLANPLMPTVGITAVNGETVSLANGQLLSELPQGVFGAADVVLTAPGTAIIDLAATGVPSGTIVEVTVKPRVGGAPVSVDTLLEPGNCDNTGTCVAGAAFDLAAGAYVVEARATFETP